MKKWLLFLAVVFASFESTAATNSVVKQYLTARAQYGLLVDTCKSSVDLTNLKGSRDFAIAYANSEIEKHSAQIKKLSSESMAKQQISLDTAAQLKASTNTLRGVSILIDYVITHPNFKTTDAGSDLYFSLVADETRNLMADPSLCDEYQKTFATLSQFAQQFFYKN